jgi:hypothetical protein
MLDRDQAVVCFFRQLKHLSAICLACACPPRAYATESVGIKNRGFPRESQLLFGVKDECKTCVFNKIDGNTRVLWMISEKNGKPSLMELGTTEDRPVATTEAFDLDFSGAKAAAGLPHPI